MSRWGDTHFSEFVTKPLSLCAPRAPWQQMFASRLPCEEQSGRCGAGTLRCCALLPHILVFGRIIKHHHGCGTDTRCGTACKALLSWGVFHSSAVSRLLVVPQRGRFCQGVISHKALRARNVILAFQTFVILSAILIELSEITARVNPPGQGTV